MLEAATLEVDESALTGESLPVSKEIEAVSGADTPLGDRVDMVYMNTNVTRGTAELMVTATGMSTEVGHISGMLAAEDESKTPLTVQLDALTKQIIVIAMVALAVSVAISWPADSRLPSSPGRRFRDRRDSNGPASGRHLFLLHRHHHAGRGARDREAPALGRDAGCDVGHQLGQDWHAHPQSDDGRRNGHRGPRHGLGRRLFDEGQITQVGGVPRSTSLRICCRWRWRPTRWRRDGGLVGDPTEGALVVLAAKGGIDACGNAQGFPRVAVVPSTPPTN